MYLPNVKDQYQFYIFQPWRTTLYGSDDYPRQWLRVTSSQVNEFVSNVRGTVNSQSGVMVTDVVTTMTLRDFLLAMSYGSTEHVEVGITDLQSDGSNFNGLADIYNDASSFMTQAMMRSYEARLGTLIDIAKSKVGTVFHDDARNRELITEMKGITMLWGQLMNYGMIAPWRCVLSDDGGKYTSDIKKYLPEIEENYRQLKARLYYSNFVNVPYKIEQYQRDQLLRGYGV